MKDSTAKAIFGFLIGAAAGTAYGILFAPDKGSKTRKKIQTNAKEFGDNVQRNMNERFDDLKDFVDDMKEDMKKKYDNIEKKMKDKQNEIKDQVKEQAKDATK